MVRPDAAGQHAPRERVSPLASAQAWRKEALAFSRELNLNYYLEIIKQFFQGDCSRNLSFQHEIEQKIKETFGDIPAAVSPRKREVFTVPDHTETLSVVAQDKETAFPSVEVLYKKELHRAQVHIFLHYYELKFFSKLFHFENFFRRKSYHKSI